jgi:hypothetical protein
MQNNDKPNQAKPSTGATPAAPAKPPAKKKLTLDVTDVSEVLERKISP